MRTSHTPCNHRPTPRPLNAHALKEQNTRDITLIQLATSTVSNYSTRALPALHISYVLYILSRPTVVLFDRKSLSALQNGHHQISVVKRPGTSVKNENVTVPGFVTNRYRGAGQPGS